MMITFQVGRELLQFTYEFDIEMNVNDDMYAHDVSHVNYTSIKRQMKNVEYIIFDI